MKMFTIIFSWLLSCSLISQAQQLRSYNKDSTEVANRMLAFLTAFNNLNWEEFKSFIDDKATAFLESDTLTLVESKTGIEKMFKPIFDETPRHVKGPPYLHLQPLNMHVSQEKNGAVVSFHLKRGAMIARRSFVWRKQGKTWLIIHIHGSVVKSD
jgi:hypothetical protein